MAHRAPVPPPKPGRFHLHRFRFQSVEVGSGRSIYACRCGVAKVAI